MKHLHGSVRSLVIALALFAGIYTTLSVNDAEAAMNFENEILAVEEGEFNSEAIISEDSYQLAKKSKKSKKKKSKKKKSKKKSKKKKSKKSKHSKKAQCNSIIQVSKNGKVWKRSIGFVSSNGRSCGKQVKCAHQSTLVHISGDTYQCKPTGPTCQGTAKLKNGEQLWRRASNKWLTKDGSRCYTNAICHGGKFQVQGDTHTCVIPKGPVCQGTAKLNNGEQLWRRASNKWLTKDGSRCYTNAICHGGKFQVQGDTHTCVIPKGPVCRGHVYLQDGEEVLRKASNKWISQKDERCYTNVKCPRLRSVGNDIYRCIRSEW